jgi:two-component system nitrate/nitrite response regulator NarL
MAALLANRPTLPIAILADLDEPRVAAEALAQDAMGRMQKSMGADGLINAVRLMLAGERLLPADLMPRPASSVLTPHEHEVARLLARGHSDKAIAHELSLHVGTIKVHVKSMLRKFDTTNRTQFALRFHGM